MIPISAIICTYNRSKMLAGALESLVQQSLNTKEYEIIVVDNASTDETQDVVRAFKKKYAAHRIIRIYEPRQGLGYARNAALRRALGKYIAYIDDDARAKSDWLKTAIELFETVKPAPICVGGPIRPLYGASKPVWFKDDYEIRTWGDKARFLGRGEKFSGSNMIFRRELIERSGGFNEKLGMLGNYISFGEESSFFEKLWKHENEVSLYYSPGLTVYHAVPGCRMTVSYQLKRSFARGQAWQLRYMPESSKGRLWLSVRTLANIYWFCMLVVVRASQYEELSQWMIECFAPVTYNIGRLLGGLGFFIPVKHGKRRSGERA